MYNWLIPKSSVASFEKRLKTLSSTNVSNPISFKRAVEWIGPEKAPLLINNMLKRKIKYNYISNKLSEVVGANNIAYILQDNNDFSVTGYKVMQNQNIFS